ncbi:hypothetical protein ACLBSQ_33660, partial [Klebsiella pneumoniae]
GQASAQRNISVPCNGAHGDACNIDTSVQNKHKHNTDDNTIIIEAATKLADQTARKRAIGMGNERKAVAVVG